MKKIIKIGHRGAAGYAPENTIISFNKAMELNVDMIEFDVHACKSGEIVVMHDNAVDRTTDGHGRISNLSLFELKQLKIDNSSGIPTLPEVIDALNPNYLVNIELKGKNTALPVAKFLHEIIIESDWDFNNFLISSFRFKSLAEFKKNVPEIDIGINHKRWTILARWQSKILKPKSIHLSAECIKQHDITLVHKLGYQVYVYNVNSDEEIKKIQSMDVDGIFSDYPDKLAA
ncbi:glycerophosphodiester phosphodiesterase [Patescibacteria group bacterium]|nr:glycerophosphodiester phosphodiesterase [Patescibacteria group bacterium]MBU0964329.1 glycerophosphodiester phosphodiesterase [Patescibacteria group bacterium]